MHTARHSFATEVTTLNGILKETVSKILEENLLKTTQVYARILLRRFRVICPCNSVLN